MPLPHRFPFAFIDPQPPIDGDSGPATVRVRLTQGARLMRGRAELPHFLLVEMVAQASAVMDGEQPADPTVTEPKAVFLAGCEARFSEDLIQNPLSAGDELSIHMEPSGAFGRLRRVASRVVRVDGDLEETVAEIELMLSA